MECQIPTEIRVNQRIMGLFFRLIGRIDGLHTEVEAQDEIVEVQTETKSITDGQVLDYILYLKLTFRLFGIIS